MNKFILPQKIFITGTDTHIGKTIISAIFMAGLRGVYWKPIQSGLQSPTDTQYVQTVTGLPEAHFATESYRLQDALSPHASAAMEGVRIELSDIHPPESTPGEHLIIEGAGGIMVPINEQEFMVDLMKKLAVPVLLVASSLLGTINHTLLSLEALRHNDLEILGVILNGPLNFSNCQAIEHFGSTSVLAQIDEMEEINFFSLRTMFYNHFRKNEYGY